MEILPGDNKWTIDEKRDLLKTLIPIQAGYQTVKIHFQTVQFIHNIYHALFLPYSNYVDALIFFFSIIYLSIFYIHIFVCIFSVHILIYHFVDWLTQEVKITEIALKSKEKTDWQLNCQLNCFILHLIYHSFYEFVRYERLASLMTKSTEIKAEEKSPSESIGQFKELLIIRYRIHNCFYFARNKKK